MNAVRLAEIEAELAEIIDRMDWMKENFFGCDWCCGGGDEEMADLRYAKERLEAEKREIEISVVGE